MINNTNVEKMATCEALNCSNNATEQIQVRSEKDSFLRFQLCSECKNQFFKEEV